MEEHTNLALIEIAQDNRLRCTECFLPINKNEKFFRRYKQGYRSSHTINICIDCIVKMNKAITKKDIITRKKLNMLSVIRRKQ